MPKRFAFDESYRMPIEADNLLKEIRAAFPQVPMPAKRDLRFHPEGCFQCEHLSEYLALTRGKPVEGAIIRYMHQEMSCLSAKGWLGHFRITYPSV